MTNTTYIAVMTPVGRRWSWDILNVWTGEIVEGGFFSKAAAEDYIQREYTPTT